MPENTPPEIEQPAEVPQNRADRRAAKRGHKVQNGQNGPAHLLPPKSGFVPPRQYSTRRRSG